MEDPCGPSCSTAPAASGWQRYRIPRRGQARSSSRWMPAGSAARTFTSWTASSRRPRTRSRRATSSPGRSRPSAPTSRIDLPVGAKVAVDPSMYCGYCRRCRSGRDNLCENWAAIGDTVSGAFAEYVAVPAVNAHRLPDGFDGQLGAMVEPLACAVHGLRRLGPLFGDSVVLTGAGTMGLLLLQLLVHSGAGPVTVVDRVPDRLEVARKLGAARVVGRPRRAGGGAVRDRGRRDRRARGRPRRVRPARPGRPAARLRRVPGRGRAEPVPVPGLQRRDHRHRLDGDPAQLRPGRRADRQRGDRPSPAAAPRRCRSRSSARRCSRVRAGQGIKWHIRPS